MKLYFRNLPNFSITEKALEHMIKSCFKGSGEEAFAFFKFLTKLTKILSAKLTKKNSLIKEQIFMHSDNMSLSNYATSKVLKIRGTF